MNNKILKAAKVICYGVGLLISEKIVNGINESTNDLQEYGYDKAVQAIMDCDSMTSYKLAMIKNLKKNETKEYYNSIMAIANSDMLGSYKVAAIEKL